MCISPPLSGFLSALLRSAPHRLIRFDSLGTKEGAQPNAFVRAPQLPSAGAAQLLPPARSNAARGRSTSVLPLVLSLPILLPSLACSHSLRPVLLVATAAERILLLLFPFVPAPDIRPVFFSTAGHRGCHFHRLMIISGSRRGCRRSARDVRTACPWVRCYICLH